MKQKRSTKASAKKISPLLAWQNARLRAMEELDKLLLEGMEGPFTELPTKAEMDAMFKRIEARSARYRANAV